jgi:hypothetical protein
VRGDGEGVMCRGRSQSAAYEKNGRGNEVGIGGGGGDWEERAQWICRGCGQRAEGDGRRWRRMRLREGEGRRRTATED